RLPGQVVVGLARREIPFGLLGKLLEPGGVMVCHRLQFGGAGSLAVEAIALGRLGAGMANQAAFAVEKEFGLVRAEVNLVHGAFAHFLEDPEVGILVPGSRRETRAGVVAFLEVFPA